MIEFLIESKEDTTVLTCGGCAIEIYEELLKDGCVFVQNEDIILDEIRNSDIVEVTKLHMEELNKDIYLILEMKDERYLNNRVVLVDSCVEEFVDIERIPSSSSIVSVEDDEPCDECITVEEIINNGDIVLLSEALRDAYQRGRESAIAEIIDAAYSIYE